ncbi:MAG: pitrilysin family protein [Patescibacteria group bacterium]
MKKVSIGKLSNGMKVYIQYDFSASSCLWGIGIKAGSLYDPQSLLGMAHLTEHVMCAESKNLSNYAADLLFEKFTGGPEGNIMISTDKTCTFFGPLNSLYYERHMKSLFEMLSQIIKDRVITEDRLAAEKAAINNEHYLRGVDIAETIPSELIHQALYETNLARNGIDGNMEHVRSATLKEVRQFVKQYYTPQNMFLIFLGPNFQKAMEIAKQNFGDWDPPKIQTFPPINIKSYDIFPVLNSIKSLELAKTGTSQYHVMVGFPTETYLSHDATALDIIAQLIAFRMKRRLRDANLDFNKGTYRALGFTERTFLHGIIYFGFATLDAEFAKYGENIILEECRKLKTELADPKELDACIFNSYYQFLDAFKNCPADLADMILRAATNGDTELEKMHLIGQNTKNITRSKIREVANKYFTDNYARAILKPVL